MLSNNSVAILIELNRLLSKRLSRYKSLYYIFISLIFLSVASMSYGSFIAQPTISIQDMYKSVSFTFLYSLSFSLMILEFRYRSSSNIALFKISRFPIHPHKIFYFFMRTMFADLRMVTYLCALTPLTIGMSLHNFHVFAVLFFVASSIIYFVFFELLFLLLFIARERLSDAMNKRISFSLPVFAFIIIGISSKNLILDIPLLDLPIKILISLTGCGFFTSLLYAGILVGLCVLSFRVCFWVTKKAV